MDSIECWVSYSLIDLINGEGFHLEPNPSSHFHVEKTFHLSFFERCKLGSYTIFTSMTSVECSYKLDETLDRHVSCLCHLQCTSSLRNQDAKPCLYWLTVLVSKFLQYIFSTEYCCDKIRPPSVLEIFIPKITFTCTHITLLHVLRKRKIKRNSCHLHQLHLRFLCTIEATLHSML